MLRSLYLLAAAGVPGPEEVVPNAGGTKFFGLGAQDLLLISGVVVILALLLFTWVYLTRKNARQRYTEGGAKIIYKADKKDLERSARRMKHRRRRQEHPDNLPRNPTLAEAGGLPPIRPDEPSEPAH